MTKKQRRFIIGALAGTAALTAWLTAVGRQDDWGSFRFLFKGYEEEVAELERRNDPDANRNKVLFYGASNFRLWTRMQEDLAPYQVLNHGFGGSTDELLVKYAPRLLYPYTPDIVFIQTGSNDYVSLSGTQEEKVAHCMEYKRRMFAKFHEVLPETKFVIMSGLLLPGRSAYTRLTQAVNRELEKLCEKTDYLWFVDASAMTYRDGCYDKTLFVKDGIHLNHTGQLRWRDGYILPQLKLLVAQFGLEHLNYKEEIQ